MLKYLRNPAADDNVELLDESDDGDLSIKYRIQRHWRKYRLVVLPPIFFILAVVVFAIIFALTKKSNSEGM